MDNFFAYHTSCRSDPSDDVVEDWRGGAQWTLACSIYKCYELSFQFMHDHDDLQWLSHGSSERSYMGSGSQQADRCPGGRHRRRGSPDTVDLIPLKRERVPVEGMRRAQALGNSVVGN